MILKSIKLNNIRSYLTQEIRFPTGSVLLSGDVGSGKSTILLAIEFALFGIRRKYLSGESLLRNGKNHGFVELHFSIEGTDYIIKRTLKRTKDEVQQEAGYVLSNNVKKEGTPIELKSFILELLGYPHDLLTKTKNLVYRYTVYTPQEEMKQILFDEEENRLDTLRKVFGIDKYKQIRENCCIYIRELKEKNKEYLGKIYDLEEKKKQKIERDLEIKDIQLKINILKPALLEAEKNVREQRTEIELVDAKRLELKSLEKELGMCDIQLRNTLDQRKRNSDNLKLLQDAVEKQRKDIPEQVQDPKKIAEEFSISQQQLDLLEKQLILFGNKVRECEIKIQQSESLKKRISKINQCPTCDQKVDEEHKDFITNRENNTIAEYKKMLNETKEEELKLQKQILDLKKRNERLRKQEMELKVLNVKIQNLTEKIKQIKDIESEQEKVKQQVGEINIKKKVISDKIIGYARIEEQYVSQKNLLETLQIQKEKLALDMNSLERDKQGIEKIISLLDMDIQEKLRIKDRLSILKDLQDWIESYFISLMTTMEKQVMLRIYHEFNQLFQNWFNILIEDESINVRLDDQFTPIVEENGYEIELYHLSGGEKTSCALAYRLALNKVINDIISTVKTKDLIILDEPTDGFSTEQLDKVRDVLEELHMNQVIIVSHETKIESFVNKVIRIHKEEHVSSVVG